MKKSILFLLLISLVGYSCTNEIDDLNVESVSPAVAAPIGTFRLGADRINDLGGDFNIRETNDQSIEFYYDVEFISTPLFDRFALRDQLFSQTIPFNAAAFSNGEIEISSPDEYNSYTIQNTDRPESEPQLTLVNFKAGSITVDQQKNFDHTLTTDIILPTLTKDGVPLSFTLVNNDSFTESLQGYVLDLTGVNADTFNTIEYDLTALIQQNGVSVTGEFSVNFALQDANFSYLEGDLRNYTFDQVQGEFEIGLPESDFPDNIGFTDPKLDLYAFNSAGIPFGLDINEIGVIEANGDTAAITGSFLQENWVLEGASVAGQLGESNFRVSKDNTDNLVDFISNIPDRVYFDGILNANPNTSGRAENFLTDSSNVSIEGQLILPLTGYVNNYSIIDTLTNVDINLSENESVSLENINLRMIAENAFPINIAIQLYFIDSTENQGDVVLDSLFNSVEESVISPSAEVDNSGIITNATSLLSDISVDREKYERIKDCDKIKLVGTLFSPGADQNPPNSIKITSDNYISLKLGLSAQATIDPQNF